MCRFVWTVFMCPGMLNVQNICKCRNCFHSNGEKQLAARSRNPDCHWNKGLMKQTWMYSKENLLSHSGKHDLITTSWYNLELSHIPKKQKTAPRYYGEHIQRRPHRKTLLKSHFDSRREFERCIFCFNLRSNMLKHELAHFSTHTKFSIEVIWMKMN